MQPVGKILSLLGVIFFLLGLLFNFMPDLPKIPGDIYIDKPGIRIYIPWLSAIVLSIIITTSFNFFK